MGGERDIKSVAVIGAGAAGTITAAALKAEDYFERIRVFERREAPGGTWLFDPDPQPNLQIFPGKLPLETDPPLKIPPSLPQVTPPNTQERYSKTPVYNSLTTNVPDIAMSFSDTGFAYGPFPPHWVPRQYLQNYHSEHKTDSLLVLNTTVEDVSKLPPSQNGEPERWKLTLRKYDPARHVDIWWEEEFDAVVIANGHYSVPYVPQVKGLEAYLQKYPGRVVHSKYYRSPLVYQSKRVLVIGNSASGHDVSAELVSNARLPVYQSRRSKSRWDGDEPPTGIEWKPVIKEYSSEDGRIIFEDDTYLDDIDTVIYCTGYRVSFPFWNSKVNGRELFDYTLNKLKKVYWHTFFQDFPTLGIVGIPRALTYRSFEYQAIALARLWSGRNCLPLPPVDEQARWEKERESKTRSEGRNFHDIPWDSGETLEYLDFLFRLSGLGTLKGAGRIPPVLSDKVIWALEHIRKYPIPGDENDDQGKSQGPKEAEREWVLVEKKDSLAFI
ncbi:FAD/NAD(P)-binding domain-containing protein [Pleurostoma richardsiae]|uniref:FAD/NAD(P)-binding domain-containing protein n=1 Tax=Pleurostoma richardsiae TaxID=41990 RepID=A0AA38RU38_9PEZI|nr:FAD/NAD(P)-binding domain-containing protein [Pleurostoma richardsiae]